MGNSIAAIAGMIALVLILVFAHKVEEPRKPIVAAPVIERVEPKIEPKVEAKPVQGPVRRADEATIYHEVLKGGKKGTAERCKSTKPIPADEVESYSERFNVTEAEVKSSMYICVF